MAKVKEFELPGLTISWPEGIDPTDWRNIDVDLDEDDADDDVEKPTPQYVVDILGFDPNAD
jgi:hypothetical protein